MQQRIVIPVAQHPVSQPLQRCSSRCIVFLPRLMLSAIQLDDQLGLRTHEIRDVAGNGYLAAESEAFQLPPAQVTPDTLFGIGRVVA